MTRSDLASAAALVAALGGLGGQCATWRAVDEAVAWRLAGRLESLETKQDRDTRALATALSSVAASRGEGDRDE